MQTLKKKKLIIANSVLMLLLIVGCVYAWFAVNYNNEVDSNNVTIVADSALELSVDGGKTWKNALNLSTDTEWFSSVKFTDITGSGDGNFLRPNLTQYADHAEVDGWSDTVLNPNFDYVRFTLKMRSAEPINVYLGDGSAVTPSAEALTSTSGTVVNQSAYSTSDFKFSKDIVVGAVRVSAIDSDGSRLFTWIPKPEIYFPTDASNYTNYSDIITNATGGDSYSHQYYADNSATATTTLEDNLVTSTITANTQQLLCTLDNKDSNGFYTGQVDICIWLEGCDNEARRAFVGGKFSVDLKLTSTSAATS